MLIDGHEHECAFAVGYPPTHIFQFRQNQTFSFLDLKFTHKYERKNSDLGTEENGGTTRETQYKLYVIMWNILLGIQIAGISTTVPLLNFSV